MLQNKSPKPVKPPQCFGVVGMGSSWGGVAVLSQIVKSIPASWTLPIVIIQHQHSSSGGALAKILSKISVLPVIDVEDNDILSSGNIYIAPANYHLLIEQDKTFALSLEAPVNFSRPSVDVTFSSLSHVFHNKMIGVVLTGANEDGAAGVGVIRENGGYTIAQSPATAEARLMPEAAIKMGVNAVLEPGQIVPHIMKLQENGRL